MENDTQLSQQQEDLTSCPSFSCYSTSGNSAEIAARVAAEYDGGRIHRNGDDDDGEDEFEFAFVSESNGDLSRTGTVFPVFNRDLAIDTDNGDFVSELSEIDRVQVQSSVLIPLGKLLLEEREEMSNDRVNDSCSSSDDDELENVPAGSYCVWRPKAAEPPSCKKSKSTGSASKRWKFRDFMRRSNSDGKESFVFLTPKQKESKVVEKEIELPKRLVKGRAEGSSVGFGGGARWSPSAHEALYVRNRAVKEGDRRKSYLPYRKDLVGFFSNVSVLGKSFPHF